MKKIASVLIATTMLLGLFVGAAHAQENEMRWMVAGTVTQNNSDSLVLKVAFQEFMTAKVLVNAETDYRDVTNKPEKDQEPPKLAQTDIKVGDKVVCFGLLSIVEGEDSTFTAKNVNKVKDFPKPQPPRDERREDKKPEIMGLFKSLGDGKLTLTNPEGDKELQIEVNDKTKFVRVGKGEKGREKEEIKPEDLKPGDKIVCIAMPVRPKEGEDKGHLVAMLVMVVDEFPPPPQPKEMRVIGTFKAVEGGYLVVAPKNTEKVQEIKFAFNDKTKFVYISKPTEGNKPEPVQKKLEDLKPGQKVMIGTTPIQEKDGTHFGRAIVVMFLDEFPPEVNFGEVEEISSGSLTIKMPERGKDNPEKKLTFTINKDTKFFIMQRGEKPKEATWSDLKKGDKVEVEHRDGVALVVRKMMMEKKD